MTIEYWELPPGWKWATMGEVADVIGGGTPKTNDSSNYEGGTIPWLTPADLSGYAAKTIGGGARYITKKGLATSSAKLMPAGAVLFTSRAPIGYVAIASNPVCTNQGFKSFVLKNGLLPDYVYWWLKGSKNLAENMASGTTFLELSGAKVKMLPIPVPPIDQQKRIVAEIEKQFSRLDGAVANLNRAKANLKRYKAAVLKAAVEGRLVETEAVLARREGRNFETGEQFLERILEARRNQWKGKGKYKEPAAPENCKLPELPEGWAYATADQLTHENRAITYGVIKLGAPVAGGVPVLRSSDVRQLRLDLNDVKRISPKIAENYHRTSLKGGEVVLTVRGTLGGIAVVPDQCSGFNVSREVAMLALVDPTMAHLIAYFIASAPLQGWLMSRTKGIAYMGINIETLKALPIPIPPAVERRRIITEVDRHLSLIREADTQVITNIERSECLRTAMLSKVFAGIPISNETILRPLKVRVKTDSRVGEGCR